MPNKTFRTSRLIAISLFDEVEISGDAVFATNADGKGVHAVQTAEGDDGGGQAVMSTMNNLLAGLQSVISNQLPDDDLGLIASRLPWLHFTGNEDGGGTFSMSWKDSQTGAVHTRQFSADGDYIGSSDMAEVANSDDFFKSMGQQFIEIAMDSRHESNSHSRCLHGGCMPIYSRKLSPMPANRASWRSAA